MRMSEQTEPAAALPSQEEFKQALKEAVSQMRDVPEDTPDLAEQMAKAAEPKPRFIPSTSDDRTANNTMRQKYRVLTADEKKLVDAVKGLGELFLKTIEAIEILKGRSREQSIAKTKLEEAVMWSVKGITA